MSIDNYIVYKHICPNGKVYIGITCREPEQRWNYGNGYKGQVFFNAIQKYGWNNIKHEIVYKNLTQKEAEEREQYLIYAFDSTNRKYGYNVALGGFINRHTNESKKKISLSLKGNKNCLGRHISKETKDKISRANKGKKRSEDFKNKRKEYMPGKKHTLETCKKIKESNIGKHYHDQAIKDKISKANTGSNNGMAKKVICLNNNMIFDTLSEAKEWAGLKESSGICGCCNGRYKSAGKHPVTGEKLAWKYYEEAV